jgi:hypothetical protein
MAAKFSRNDPVLYLNSPVLRLRFVECCVRLEQAGPGRTCSPWIEPQKLVELFGMKYSTVCINDMHLPSSLRHYPRLRHGDGWADVKGPRALALF